jgi:hypothetical protein
MVMTGHLKHRVFLKIVLDASLDTVVVLILTNPASIDGNDMTIDLIKKKIERYRDKINKYFNGIGTLYILNIFSFVGSKLEDFNDYNDDELFYNESQNLNFIRTFLEENYDIIDKIIMASGQHFIRTTFLKDQINIHQKSYLKHYIEILEVLKNYQNKIYCCGLVNDQNKKKEYPVYISAKNLNNKQLLWHNELKLFSINRHYIKVHHYYLNIL